MPYTARLSGREMIYSGVVVLHFEKPDGYSFRAGQFCLLGLPDIGFRDEKGLQRHLSIASSPFDGELVFATRAGNSAFKKTLVEMDQAAEVELGEPTGRFVLPNEPADPIIFLAAGIGIAPFRSMVRYISGTPTRHVVTLFYSSRTPEEAVFLGELLETAEANKNVSVIATMTRVPEASDSWQGLKGRIGPSMIREGCRDWHDALYYVAGPEEMVRSMTETLGEVGIGSDKIMTERFTGYGSGGI